MKTLICLCVLMMGGGAFGAERIRVEVRRDPPANVEYFKQTEHGLTKVKEYDKVTVKEYYEVKDGSLRKIREVTPNVQVPERGRSK